MRTNFRLIHSISALEGGLLAMACLSLALILMPLHWLSRSQELVPQDLAVTLYDDSYSGGKSRAGWVDPQSQRWYCELDANYANPYCSMQVALTDSSGRGLDLSKYEKMRVWASYRGEARHLRIYLRSRDSRFFDPNDTMTTKFNSVELPVSELKNGLEVRMSDFSVANWWLVQQEIPLEHSQPEFGDVVILEVQTSSEVRSGRHEIQVDKVVWEGPRVAKVQLYRAVIIAWSTLIFTGLIYRITRLSLELNKNKEYQEQLLGINRLLDLQSRKFEDLAKTDHLTGLLNRVGIRDALYEGLNAWKKDQKPFSFVIVDIDKFKVINDTYGHDVGDNVLKNVARLFMDNVRKTDFLARWGGEEFILVCPNTTLEQAHLIAESLRQKLFDARLFNDLVVTASFGVATMICADLDDLFKRADTALLRAKQQGRNRVESDASSASGQYAKWR